MLHMTSKSPVRLLVIIFFSVFVVETSIMFFLSTLPPVPTWMWAMFDATLLVILLSPALYFFVLRPLMQHISERKLAEEALRAALRTAEDERLKSKSIIESIGEPLGIIDTDFRFVYQNKLHRDSFGEHLGEICYKAIKNRDEGCEGCQIAESFRDGNIHSKERTVPRGKGPPLYVVNTASPLRDSTGKIVAGIEIIRDITEWRLAEEAIKLAHAELDQIFNTAADGMRLIDKDFNVLRINNTFSTLSGVSREEAIGEKCHEVFSGPMCFTPDCPLTRILGGENRVEYEAEKERKDGSKIPCIVTGTSFRGPDGQLIGIIEDFKDITIHKQAEEEVKSLKQQMEFILGATKTGLDIIDSEFNMRYIDPEWQKIYGDPTGRKCYEYYMERSEMCPGCGIPKALETKTITVTEEVLVKEGNRPIQVTTIPFQNEKGEWLVAEVNVDITERKKLEEQLLQAQKMEAVGQLAGGIAHDFNNILTVIIGFGTLLKAEISRDDPLRTNVTQILHASERAASLTQALLAFSRKQIINPKIVNLNEIIAALKKLLSRIIGEDIELATFLADEALMVMADSTHMEQVLMNLTTNARDAMPDGGSLTIRTELMQFDHEYIKAHGYGIPGPYALISVEDTGQGMDVETREKIFEPFFTTKEMGKGTGLGLAMVYGIIKQHDGYINVYSEPGKGTTFKIYLPLIKSGVEEEKPADLSVAERGTETVLVAEDDVQVRDLTKCVLEGSGYQVLDAEDGEDAMRIFKENKDRIQLLILDVVMPKKNGKEVYDEIKKIRPDMKAIFTSGYNAELIHKKGILEKGFGFIVKPSSPQELLKKVREVLDNRL